MVASSCVLVQWVQIPFTPRSLWSFDTYGQEQREGHLKNLIDFKLRDLTPFLGRLATTSRDSP